MQDKKLVLIDGHSILNRAFYGIPDLTNSEGMHTNAVYGFLNIFFRFVEEEQPDYIIVAFDEKKPTFRHEMFKDYKGTRKPMADELKEQVPVIQEVLKAMQVTLAILPGYEADDVIGTLSKQAEDAGMQVTVISGDRDLLQLASEKVKIRIPKTKGKKTEVEDYTQKEVEEKYQVTPVEFIDVKALMGDTADNIPGVPSIGEKTAIKIIHQFHDIENAYTHLDEIKPNKAKLMLQEYIEQARLSKKLATIDRNVPVPCEIKEAEKKEFFTDDAYTWMKRLEFKHMLSKFDHVDSHNLCENNFKEITEFGEASEILEQFILQDHVAFKLIIENNEALGLSIVLDEEHVYYIPIQGFITLELLQSYLQRIRGTSVYTIHLKEQLSFLELKYSTAVCDCEIAAYLLNPLKDSYDTDDLARDYTSISILSKKELFQKKSLNEAAKEETESFLKFVCYEAYIPFLASGNIMEELKQKKMLDLYRDIEMPLVYELYQMEQTGILVKKDALKQYGDTLEKMIHTCEERIYKEVGETFNINSPKQLGEILFQKMQLPGAKKTKTGFSTSAEILEKLADDYPVVKDILNYRQYTKLKSTYADGLSEYIQKDGRIHGKFNQTITATGRISSTEPNLQNIPIRMEMGKKIREVFIPKEGCVFVDADYSQIELRVLADMSKDEHLIEAYKTDQDIHRITAAKVFHVPVNEVTATMRSNAKAVNFGIIYGISSFGLSQDLSISKKEAKEYIDEYFKNYPKIKEFLDQMVLDAKKNGYVTTLFGRIRPVPELASSNFMKRSFGERIAMNSPIQGTAADIIKIAMIHVSRRLEQEHLKARIVLQVHDELLLETPKDEVEIVKKILLEEMSHAAQLKVPLEIGIEVGNNWLEAH